MKKGGGCIAHARQSTWMCAVVQADFQEQMDVFRWLQNDTQYRIIWILHDHDTVEEEHFRKMPDGTEKKLEKGATKFPHYHIIVKIPSKLSSETFSKRFGSYVNFQVCGDSKEYARYLTHETFSARDKYKYSRDDVSGDMSLYHDLMVCAKDDDTCDIIERFSDMVNLCNGDKALAVKMLCATHDISAVKSIMSHAYFYEKFI